MNSKLGTDFLTRLSRMKNAGGDCQSQTGSQQQENVWNIQMRGGVWVAHA